MLGKSFLSDNTPFPLLYFINWTGVTITQKQASIGMSALSAVFLFYLLSHIFWWTLGTSGIFTTAHAVTRDASMHKDEGDKIEMTGDLTINAEEDAAFLNPAEVSPV
mmetsp:Transcript_34107/g.45166  ORF Transcript_34107/g.45166 Transcript_34107/m.45166 type:complete len:107 (-) Transcript_34107:668-988(-)